MNRHIYKVILSALLSMTFCTVHAKTLTGKQCRELLSPISDILKQSRRDDLATINAEIPGVSGAPITVIAKKTGKSDLVKSYISAAKTAISQCESICEGLPLKNKESFRCAGLTKTRPLTLYNGLKNFLNDDAKVTLKDDKTDPMAKCAFNPHHDDCAPVEVVTESTETIIAPEAPLPVTVAPAIALKASDDLLPPRATVPAPVPKRPEVDLETIYQIHAAYLNQIEEEEQAVEDSVW